jgi:hypothetical protein
MWAKSLFILAVSALAAATASAAGKEGDSTWALYRPGKALFFVRSGDAAAQAAEIAFGTAGDKPLWADFDGDGKPEPGLYRNGQWFVSRHADGKVDITIRFGGAPGDIPLADDLDGDGRADFVVFRAGEWHVYASRNPALTQILHFGQAGDTPLLGDFDGDGKTDLVLYRAGHWYVDTNRDGEVDLEFGFGGVPGDVPLIARSGKGRAMPALFRAGEWLISEQHDGKVSTKTAFGAAGDVPLGVWTTR